MGPGEQRLRRLAQMLAWEATVRTVHADGMSAVALSNHTSFLCRRGHGTRRGEEAAPRQQIHLAVGSVSLKDDEGKRCAVSRTTLPIHSLP